MEIQPLSSPVHSNAAQAGNSNAQPVEVTKSAAAAVPVSASAVQAVSPATDAEQVKRAVKAINETVKAFTRDLEFTTDEDTKKTVVKVVDVNTREVVRQIPSEEVLNIAKALDKLQGLIIRQKA